MQAVRALAWVTGISSLLLAGAQVGEARDLADMNNAEITVLQQGLTDGGCYRGAIAGRARAALQDAIKACPQQDPVLRIETGTHVAKLSRIGVDEACRIAATVSDDKTVRIWPFRRTGATSSPADTMVEAIPSRITSTFSRRPPVGSSATSARLAKMSVISPSRSTAAGWRRPAVAKSVSK